MKIATWNINGVNGRLDLLLDWLKRAVPDVVCLQELKAAPQRFPDAALRKAGYGAVWAGQKSWNGVAILARDAQPVETRRTLPGDPADAEARYIEAAVGGILIACLYAPNGNPVAERLERKRGWLRRLKRHAAGIVDHPVVMAGDFNIIPAERDVYNPDRWKDDALFLPEMRRAFEGIIRQGWTDSLRHIQPEGELYTFWDYKRGAWARNAGLRLDHLLVSPSLLPRLQTAGIDREFRGRRNASDHAPVWIEIPDA